MSRLLRAVSAATFVMSAALSFLAEPVEAAVVHEQGFSAVVLGFRSWYGSYGMGAIGTAWCVDHGPPAPDPALDYVPAEIDRPAATKQAMAWAVSAHGPGADRGTAAAVQLVLHDLMGSRYPSGVLDVDRLQPGHLAGFGGQESQIVDRARAIKAEALARSGLQPPLTLEVHVDPVRAGEAGSVLVRVRDAAGAGVPGVPVRVSASGGSVTSGTEASTDGSGSHRFPLRAGPGNNRFEARAEVPDLALRSFAPRAARAQRVARPARLHLSAVTGFTAVPPRRLTVVKRG
ncbi:MAG TPA: Ig-like domain-containing protein, partial [Acidimicrobiales bacterium]|nr:Ig-like domain-containing protein [Acidimicrobiales bacterium]